MSCDGCWPPLKCQRTETLFGSADRDCMGVTRRDFDFNAFHMISCFILGFVRSWFRFAG